MRRFSGTRSTRPIRGERPRTWPRRERKRAAQFATRTFALHSARNIAARSGPGGTRGPRGRRERSSRRHGRVHRSPSRDGQGLETGVRERARRERRLRTTGHEGSLDAAARSSASGPRRNINARASGGAARSCSTGGARVWEASSRGDPARGPPRTRSGDFAPGRAEIDGAALVRPATRVRARCVSGLGRGRHMRHAARRPGTPRCRTCPKPCSLPSPDSTSLDDATCALRARLREAGFTSEALDDAGSDRADDDRCACMPLVRVHPKRRPAPPHAARGLRLPLRRRGLRPARGCLATRSTGAALDARLIDERQWTAARRRVGWLLPFGRDWYLSDPLENGEEAVMGLA